MLERCPDAEVGDQVHVPAAVALAHRAERILAAGVVAVGEKPGEPGGREVAHVRPHAAEQLEHLLVGRCVPAHALEPVDRLPAATGLEVPVDSLEVHGPSMRRPRGSSRAARAAHPMTAKTPRARTISLPPARSVQSAKASRPPNRSTSVWASSQSPSLAGPR